MIVRRVPGLATVLLELWHRMPRVTRLPAQHREIRRTRHIRIHRRPIHIRRIRTRNRKPRAILQNPTVGEAANRSRESTSPNSRALKNGGIKTAGFGSFFRLALAVISHSLAEEE